MANRVLELLARFSPGLPDPLPADPMALLQGWFREAASGSKVPNPDAVVLATSSAEADPSARVVLCRGLDSEQGTITLYTNLRSRKASDLSANPRTEAVFFWDHASRQARVHGPAARVPDADADHYFASRPLLSRLGAWASEQSLPLESRAALAERLLEVMDRFGVSLTDLALSRPSAVVPRPPHWGGFRVWADRVELWCMGAGRLHDRAEWVRSLSPASDKFSAGPWTARRLCP